MIDNEFLIFNTRDELLRIDMRTLVYFEASGNYTEIVGANGVREVICTGLSKIDAALGERGSNGSTKFVRIGKRYIVNLGFVRRISPLRQQLLLGDGATFEYKLAVSKEALKKLKSLYSNPEK